MLSRLVLPLGLLAALGPLNDARAQESDGGPGVGGCAGGSCAGGSCAAGGCCNNKHCPPPFVHCMERPPKIKWKCGCPRPVCDPCDLEHFGYYQTCWCPWPFPPDLRHCPCANEHPATPYLLQPLLPPAQVTPPRPETRAQLSRLKPVEIYLIPVSTTLAATAPAARLERPRVEIISVDP